MAGWSSLTQPQLRSLLRSHGQPTGGSKADLVQRFTAFMSDYREVAGDGDSGGANVGEAAAGESKAGGDARGMALQLARSEAAVVAAQAALHAHRVRHNDQTCQLLQLVGQDDLRPTFMRPEVWGVVGLWRLRGVCRAFREWARAQLSLLPRVVAVGGLVRDRSVVPPKWGAMSSVESLDLSTMRWSTAGCMPSLPDPRAWHSVSCSADGRVVVCGGHNSGGLDTRCGLILCSAPCTALQWVSGTSVWSALPDLPAKRDAFASVVLPDGRTMLIGGYNEGPTLASVVVLAADGSGWSDLPPLTGGREYAAAALLPDGKVLVAGGQSDDTALNTAELWDPATQVWTALPPMALERSNAVACVLPSGRVAVVGGAGTDDETRKDGEVFDHVKREWEPLGEEMEYERDNISAVTVPGGLVVAGVQPCPLLHPNEMYDEESGRWFTLPHAMVEQRNSTGLASVPAAALAATAAVPN